MLENKLYWDATWQAEGAMQISLPVASGANKITPLSPSTFLMKMKTIVSQDRLGTDIGKRTGVFSLRRPTVGRDGAPLADA
jgi:hypothetical protein